MRAEASAARSDPSEDPTASAGQPDARPRSNLSLKEGQSITINLKPNKRATPGKAPGQSGIAGVIPSPSASIPPPGGISSGGSACALSPSPAPLGLAPPPSSPGPGPGLLTPPPRGAVPLAPPRPIPVGGGGGDGVTAPVPVMAVSPEVASPVRSSEAAASAAADDDFDDFGDFVSA